MKKLLLLVMAVAMVGCAKENPPKPEWDGETVESSNNSMDARDEWYDSIVICVHCGSDLKKKGARVCADCGRDQRPHVQ